MKFSIVKVTASKDGDGDYECMIMEKGVQPWKTCFESEYEMVLAMKDISLETETGQGHTTSAQKYP